MKPLTAKVALNYDLRHFDKVKNSTQHSLTVVIA